MGEMEEQKFIITDTRGLCDSVTELEDEYVFNTLKNSLRSNLIKIDKVIVVCADRLEIDHKEAIKRLLEWLDYDKHAENFLFVWNKFDAIPEEDREETLNIMADVLGIDPVRSKVMGMDVRPGASYSG